MPEPSRNCRTAQKALAMLKRISVERKALACLACLLMIASLLGVWRIKSRALDQLNQTRSGLRKQGIIPFEKNVRSPLTTSHIQFWQSTRNVKAIARFKNSYFAAIDGGLIELSLAGNLLRRYSVLDGLTESDLTSLAAFNSKLYIGTQTRGLLTYDGEHFESYRWTDRQPQAITALLEGKGRLLIGTRNGGLIEFDGENFKEITTGAGKKRLLKINCLLEDNARLYVGTFVDGLWMQEAGRWLHFTIADGLPSARIVGIAASAGRLYVASDFGLAVAFNDNLLREETQPQQNVFQSLRNTTALSSLAKYETEILFSRDDGKVFDVPGNTEPKNHIEAREITWNRPADFSNCRAVVLDDKLWLLGSQGIWLADKASSLSTRAPHSFSYFGKSEQPQMLSGNVISALALDADGRLWAGNFRNGIDVLGADGRRFAHLESDTTREINNLAPDRNEKAVFAATSQGVTRFDSTLHASHLTTADGLLSNSVSQIALVKEPGDATGGSASGQLHGKELICATGRGLSIGAKGKLRGLTTTQGLPSDNLYTVLSHDRFVYVGTLGGLAQIESGRVVRVFKDSNSNLTQNWITGLCAAGQRLFVGTYGGGVFELTASGELRSFAPEIGKQIVNLNAMWSDAVRLCVGTLDGAWILDLRSQKWTHLKDELPSPVVLSVTGDGQHVYFGTTSGLARIEKSYFDESTKDKSSDR